MKVADADRTNRLESHELISNGAFLLSATETDKVQLERAKTYWDDASVALDRVTFVNTTTPKMLSRPIKQARSMRSLMRRLNLSRSSYWPLTKIFAAQLMER